MTMLNLMLLKCTEQISSNIVAKTLFMAKRCLAILRLYIEISGDESKKLWKGHTANVEL